ncbi:hypothetical protein EOM86_05660 [Candidatus Nomurabacteria bacterium]|nr:hypothetical protein [Candidatus Nomurabacteria bacterium]
MSSTLQERMDLRRKELMTELENLKCAMNIHYNELERPEMEGVDSHRLEIFRLRAAVNVKYEEINKLNRNGN